MMTCRAISGAGLALALAGLLALTGCDGAADGGRITWRSGDATRSALIVPAAGDRPAPLVVAFHGLGGSGADLMAALGDFPARSGASVVAPDALPCAPLGGTPCWPAEGDAPTGPELAAFDDLVAAASRHAPVDPERIYVLGLSNGGGWAVRLLLSRPGTVRGALVLAGYDPSRA
jgi:poly(3-hydroxybutyrate) depolymerase